MMGMTMIIGIVTEVAIFYFSEQQELAASHNWRESLILAGTNRMPHRHDHYRGDPDAASLGVRHWPGLGNAAAIGYRHHLRSHCAAAARATGHARAVQPDAPESRSARQIILLVQ